MEEAVTYVLERYGQFRLDHFYRLTFREGGLTLGQLSVLYERSQKRDELNLRFHAILHGAKFKDDKQPFKEPPTEEAPKGFVFEDPEVYAKMNPEEKEKLTQKMMRMHKKWAGQKTVPLGD